MSTPGRDKECVNVATKPTSKQGKRGRRAWRKGNLTRALRVEKLSSAGDKPRRPVCKRLGQDLTGVGQAQAMANEPHRAVGRERRISGADDTQLGVVLDVFSWTFHCERIGSGCVGPREGMLAPTCSRYVGVGLSCAPVGPLRADCFNI